MEVHHASLGRQKLEEIRLKRAAERLTKASSSASDLETLNPYGMRRSESGSGIAERDSHGLFVRVKELEKKNAELEDENKKILSKLESKEVESDSLLRRLNDLEQNTLPSLRKALKDISIEKDAAVVAREDLLGQLRMIKKRLREAEEDQYRAEEDAAALRAELISLQQQDMRNPFDDIPSITNPADQVRTMESQILNLKSELQQELVLRQQEQSKLAEEQFRVSSLMAEKQELEERLITLSQKSADASQEAALKAFSMHDKEKLEKQLHDMALMVERLEGSRQKLLMEIDSQSTEIERLFEENSHLSESYEDAVGAAAQWESQVKDCLKQNEELRSLLDKLRLDQAHALHTSKSDVQLGLMTEKDGNMFDPSANTSENLLLKEKLAQEQSRAEALSAEVMHLSAKLKHAVQSFNNLRQQYRPVLRNIENGLMKMK